MEGAPGYSSPDTQPDIEQQPVLDEALIAQRVAESLQGGLLGQQVRQTFGAINAAGQRIETVAGEVADLKGRVDQAGTQLDQATEAAKQDLKTKGQAVQESLFSTEQAMSASLERKGKNLLDEIEQKGAAYVRDAKQAAQDAGKEADRATVEAERVDGAVKATAQMITEARVVANGLQSGSLAKVVEAIRYIKAHPEDHRQEIALLKKAQGLAAPAHVNQPLVNVAMEAGVPVWLHGEAGSGKSTAAEIAAERYDLKYRAINLGPTTTETKFAGFVDANGNVYHPGFREIYTNGGIFLFDEIDNGNAGVLTALNSGIGNNHFEFPDARVPKHATTRFIAAANTIGKGATADYIGRNRIDAATIDRFAFIEWNIDETLEDSLMLDMPKREAAQEMGHEYKEIDITMGGIPNAKEWLQTVQSYRRVADENKLKVLITPRASMYGKMLTEVGVGDKWLKEMLIYKGMDPKMRDKLDQHVNRPYR